MRSRGEVVDEEQGGVEINECVYHVSQCWFLDGPWIPVRVL